VIYVVAWLLLPNQSGTIALESFLTQRSQGRN
jgi:hypothetical protein